MVRKRNGTAYAVLALCIIGLSVFGIGCAKPSFASIEQVERSDDELLILEVYVNNTVRNRGLIAYLPEQGDVQDTLLPVSALGRALSYSLRSNPADGIVEGWFRAEKNAFQLDMVRKIVVIGGREIPLPDGVAEAHFEDIYVRASALEEWLEIKLVPDISMMRLQISSPHPFPFEEEMERKKRAQSRMSGAGDEPIKYDKSQIVPYQWWSRPSLVLQQSVQGRRDHRRSSIDTSFSLQSSADALQFGSRFLLSGAVGTNSDPRIGSAQLTLQKSDPDNDLLGPLRAGKISVGDITFNDVPLASGRRRGRGISVSSNSDYNYFNAVGAETFDLEGDAPIGWDAELYRNGYFIAFQEIGDDGRYKFEDVNLLRGFNLFQIILYGPEGQKRTQTQRVMRGAEMQRQGHIDYSFALGQPDADFIPIAKNSTGNAPVGASGRIAYGLKEYLTVGASVYSGRDNAPDVNGDRQISGALSAVATFWGVKAQGQVMAANEGRSGYSVDVTTRVKDTNLYAGHTVYNGFSPQDKDLLGTTSVSANRNFGLFSANARAEHSTYQRKNDELRLQGGLSTRLSGVQITTDIDRKISDNKAQESFTGSTAAATHLFKWRVRANLNYDLQREGSDKMQSANISAMRSLDRDSSLRLNSTYSFYDNGISADVRYTRQFEKFALDFNAGGTSNNTYFGGVTVRTGLQADHNGDYKIVSAREGGLGSVGLRAFIDINGNGLYDEGEPPVSNIAFRSNRGAVKGSTNEEGFLFVNGIPEGPTRFTINTVSMPSIYLKPAKDTLDVIPRNGVIATLDVPFEQLGEIDGFVYAENSDDPEKPFPGVEVVLIDAQTGTEIAHTDSEYDGYYVFSAIPMGEYIVKAMPLWGTDVTGMPSANVSVTFEKPNRADINLVMPSSAHTQSRPSPPEKDPFAELFITAREHEIQAQSNDQGAKPETEKESVIVKPQNAPKVVTQGVDIDSGEELRGMFIHIGSMGNHESAQAERRRLWEKYADILDIVPLYIYEIRIGDQRYFRIVGAVDDRAHGDSLCTELKNRKSEGGCALLGI